MGREPELHVQAVNAAVLVVSDGVAGGRRTDDAGPALVSLLEENGFTAVETAVVPDEQRDIEVEIGRLAKRSRLVVTTGGTGFGPRDVTPEATRAVIEREAPGLVQLMIGRGIEKTPYAALSRATIGSLGSTLVINLPGSPKGAIENLAAVLELVPHVLQLLEGDTEH